VVTGTALSTPGVFGFALSTGSAASNFAGTGLGLAVLVATSTAVLPTGSAVEARQSERPCPFASREASGSERLRLPPQIGPQPTHPVHQNAARHREVCGDVDVTPAVYNPVV
jgi:hypothetical protein